MDALNEGTAALKTWVKGDETESHPTATLEDKKILRESQNYQDGSKIGMSRSHDEPVRNTQGHI